MARPPTGGAFWSDDGNTIYYQRERAGSPLRDWFESDLQGNVVRVIKDGEYGRMDVRNGDLNRKRTKKLYVDHGDLFLKNLQSGKSRQLTKTVQRESSPRFTSDGKRVLFSRDGHTLARNLKTGFEEELIDLKFENDPDDDRDQKRTGYLREQQQRLFETLRTERSEQDSRQQASETAEAADPTHPPLPWYLGDSKRSAGIELSPNGRWCLVRLQSKRSDGGQQDKMPEFIDESGYVDVRNVRALVGTGKPGGQELLLLDIRNHTEHQLDLSQLPEIDDDPMTEIRAAGEAWLEQQSKTEDPATRNLAGKGSTEGAGDSSAQKTSDVAESNDAKSDETESGDDPEDELKESQQKKQDSSKTDRPVSISSIVWNEAGDQVAVEIQSADNKDRWIAVVKLKAKELHCIMHHRDPAWVNWRVGEMGWLPDQETLLYQTEQSGYAHVYATHIPSDSTRQLTRGESVVSDVQIGRDGKFAYYKSNVDHPGIYEIHRVDLNSGETHQLTNLGGMNDYELSPDETNLLITHSTATRPPELWVQPVDGSSEPRQLTQTVSPEFYELPWIEPRFVTVPSRTGRPIHARLYRSPNHRTGEPTDGQSNSRSPAVIFIHGAGYLQNAHQGWSTYFREFMFHSLLAHRGYVVLDMDYRASAGYGRDWRTAIYRNMGTPELEDLADGKTWLVENQSVDPDRIGLYGGSYGGFLTLMALFKEPGRYACGAALRPVTDWAHYNDGYTSNILNSPADDPESYATSSPIEYAGGLSDPLLICHGMVDDNVFFKDTVRLVQRLIELKKEDWNVAIFPVEAHGFEQPTSWLDEYRRILELFERELK